MGTKENTEFKNALRDIALCAIKLDSPFERVKCVDWVRKLASLPDDDLEWCKIRNEYAQLLRIQVHNKFLHGPFANPPQENCPLKPLPECLGNLIAQEIPNLPKAGPLSPVVNHQSPDGSAFISIKQVPGNGVLCYMAVSPDGLL